MPVTAHSMTDKAPARAWTRESPNRMAVALRPSAVTDGCAIRSKTGFARTQPWPARSVSSTRLLIARARACSSSRLCRRRWRSCYEGYEIWLNSMPRGTEVHVGVLSAAAGKAGRTLAVPIWYNYRPGGLLTVLTGRWSRKAAAIRARHPALPLCQRRGADRRRGGSRSGRTTGNGPSLPRRRRR